MPATPDSCTHASGIFRRQARVGGRSALASTGKIYTIFEGTSDTPALGDLPSDLRHAHRHLNGAVRRGLNASS
jgi:hypothetical protein